MPNEEITVNKKSYEKLLIELKEYKHDTEELKKCILSVLGLLGILDEETQSIKAKIKTGEEGYTKHILGALGDVMTLLTQSNMPIIGKKYEAKLAEKFSFIKTVLPLIDKHSKNTKH